MLARIVREIVSFAGNDIILSRFNPKMSRRDSFEFNVGCVSNDATFYVHHNYERYYPHGKGNQGLSRIPIYMNKVYSQRILFNKIHYLNNLVA